MALLDLQALQTDRGPDAAGPDQADVIPQQSILGIPVCSNLSLGIC
jgi:hypothetical protein